MHLIKLFKERKKVPTTVKEGSSVQYHIDIYEKDGRTFRYRYGGVLKQDELLLEIELATSETGLDSIENILEKITDIQGTLNDASVVLFVSDSSAEHRLVVQGWRPMNQEELADKAAYLEQEMAKREKLIEKNERDERQELRDLLAEFPQEADVILRGEA